MNRGRYMCFARLLTAAMATGLFAGAWAEEAPVLDPDSGLVVDAGWETVRANCSACHSLKLVTQNRGNRETWASMILWMQKTQGLWAFDQVTETAILDYLARNYAPAASSRRAPLMPELMPVNPYQAESAEAGY